MTERKSLRSAHRPLDYTFPMSMRPFCRHTLLITTICLSRTRFAHAQGSSWTLGPFAKPNGVNPIITPSAAAIVLSPINDSLVRWEQYATFNPAAMVRNGKVYLLYRAEDTSGDSAIGHHTSRIGLAE